MTNTANKTLNVLEMRWGYTGDQMACGPVEGSTITEMTFRTADGKLYFVSVSRMMEFFNAYVSEVPLYEIEFWIDDRHVELEDALEKLNKYSKERYSSELGEYDEMEKSEFLEEMKLVLCANDYFRSNMDEEPDPEEWLEQYRDGNIAIELLKPDWDEEEEE